MSSIKKKFVSGVVWESFGRFSALGIQFVVTIIIARLLTPEQFGVIGLLTVFIALGQIFLDSGFSQALIQKKDATRLDLSTIYFLNIFLGIVIYSLLYLCSPYIADFYNMPELTNYARVLFLIIPINSFGLIQNVIIQKELAFKKTALASLLSAVFSGIVGILMAYKGYGIWALVGQQVTIHASRTLLYIIQRRWLPIFKVSFGVIKEMFGFSVNLLAHSVVNVTMKNIYVLVIGKFFPVAQVGYYNQASKFEEVSAATISQVVLKVSFPALVQKLDQPTYLRSAYQKIFSTTIYIIAPLMFFLMIIAEPMFRFLLTEKWLPAVPYFQALGLYGMLLPTLQISYNLYKLFRKGRTLLVIDIIRHALVVISIFLTIQYGVLYMLFGFVASTFIMCIANLVVSGKLINLSLKEQISTILPYYTIAFITAVIVYLFPAHSHDLITIAYKALIFGSIYIIMSKILNLEGFKEVLFIFKSFKQKLKK